MREEKNPTGKKNGFENEEFYIWPQGGANSRTELESKEKKSSFTSDCDSQVKKN